MTITDNDSAPGDADGDGYTVINDCNDNDATVYPGAREIKHDGVAQDCNGYDLTINILKAQFDTRRGKPVQADAIDMARNLVYTCAVSAHLVDASPLSLLGALCIAAAPEWEDRNKLFRKLLIWGMAMSVFAALISFIFWR